MVAKFISVADFAIRAGLGNVDNLADDVTAKARASIEAATLHLISIIRTEFDAVTAQVDNYYVDSGEQPYVGDFPRALLSRGFVTTVVGALVVKISDQLPDLPAASTITNDYTVLESDKGTVLLTGTDRLQINALVPISGTRFFMSITYDAGFTTKSDAFGTIYENTPEWLKEAAQIISKSIFDTGVPCDDKDKNSLGCCISIEGLVNRYIRWVPSAIKPLS